MINIFFIANNIPEYLKNSKITSAETNFGKDLFLLLKENKSNSALPSEMKTT